MAYKDCACGCFTRLAAVMHGVVRCFCELAKWWCAMLCSDVSTSQHRDDAPATYRKQTRSAPSHLNDGVFVVRGVQVDLRAPGVGKKPDHHTTL